MGGFGFGFGFASGRHRRPPGGSTPPPAVAGTLATAFASAPATHYHPNSQAVAVDDAGRLTSCPDIQGLAAILAASGVTAPRLMTDALGRAFLRFNGGEAAVIENALTANQRGWTAILVGRVHQQKAISRILIPRFSAYTSPTVNTAIGDPYGYIRPSNFSTNGVAYLAATTSPSTVSNLTDCHKVIPGTQMQVIGIASRTTANGGTRLYINNDTCDVAQQGAAQTFIGGVLGGKAGASNGETISADSNAQFDLYELALWTGELGNAVTDALVAAAVANFAIPQLDTNFVIEGDSISDGIFTVLPEQPANCRGIASRLAEPGAGYVPGNVRVIELATSGHSVPNLVSRRDAVNTVFGAGQYPGGAANNIVAFQIGRNDMIQQDTTAAVHYANVVALINTADTGYLQRGWRVVAAGNIATTAGVLGTPPDGVTFEQQRIEAYRALLFSGTAINPTFQNDTLSGSGQTYDGLVSAIPLHEITVDGVTCFKTSADAYNSDAGYYDSDQTHTRVAGIDLMISGGDEPVYGYGSIV